MKKVETGCWGFHVYNNEVFISFQTVTLSVGIVLLVVSGLLAYFINKQTDVLFSQPGPRRQPY